MGSARPTSKRGAVFDTGRPARDRYQIIGQISAGGMADILLARAETKAGAPLEVVVKRLRDDLCADDDFVKMFRDEARLGALLSHPNIGRVYELFELDGALCLSMELVRGTTLREIQDRSRQQGRSVPLQFVVHVAIGALAALDYAHRFADDSGKPLGVVHRDVSLQNLLVTYEGLVKLLDFGVARAEGRLHRTEAGSIKGTLAYMAPEQIMGGSLDGRTDLFALGIVLYQLALDRHPFFERTDAEVLNLLSARLTPATQVDPQFPRGLEAILQRAMQKECADRYPHAQAMLDGIQDLARASLKPYATDGAGRFLQKLFRDRIELEAEARASQDDRLLLEAYRVGARPRGLSGTRGKRGRPSPPSREAIAAALTADTVNDFDDSTAEGVVSAGPLGLEAGTASDVVSAVLPSDVPTAIGVISPAATDSSIARVAGVTATALDRSRTELSFDRDALIREEALDSAPDAATDDISTVITSEVLQVSPRAGSTAGVSILREGRRERGPTSWSGRRLGRYQALERIASSDVAETYAGRLTGAGGFERLVTIHRIMPLVGRQPEVLALLLAELARAGTLTHHNICQVIDVGVQRDQHYLVTEGVRGWTLQAILDRCRTLGMHVPYPFACRIVGDACAALHAAHTAGAQRHSERILHGGVTPERILISTQGSVKVTGFVLARIERALAARGDETPVERLERERERFDIRSDLFFAGVTLYEALVIQKVDATVASLDARLSGIFRPVVPVTDLRRDLPRQLDAVVDLAILGKLCDGYGSAHLMQQDLERQASNPAGVAVTSVTISDWVQRLELEPTPAPLPSAG